jgi:hypothetical protein
MEQPITTTRLTKKFFLTLQDGVYLVSNVYDSSGKPAYAAYVAPTDGREAQWRSIKDVGADGRHCDVFRHEDAYKEFRKTIKHLPPRLNDKSTRFLEAICEAILEDDPKPPSR